MKCCKRCTVSGQVQGVFFRQGTNDQANELGVNGWVRNLANGDVECVICGDEEAVNTMCDWLWHGPDAAKVSNVKIEDVAWEEHNGFSIKRSG